MAVQNILLTAVTLGLGTHIKTGAIMNDASARAAVGVPGTQRIVAVVNVGVPSEEVPARKREPAAAFTTWVP
jgi:nitroreductase